MRSLLHIYCSSNLVEVDAVTIPNSNIALLSLQA